MSSSELLSSDELSFFCAVDDLEAGSVFLLLGGLQILSSSELLSSDELSFRCVVDGLSTGSVSLLVDAFLVSSSSELLLSSDEVSSFFVVNGLEGDRVPAYKTQKIIQLCINARVKYRDFILI